MYVKIINGAVSKYPYSLSALKKDNPNTSFPKSMSDERMEAFGVFPVVFAESPEYDERTQKQVQSETPELINGKWTITTTVVDLTPEEVEMYTSTLSRNVRQKRNEILTYTDWMALSDNTLTEDWAAYRQALRDLPSQEGFPYNVIWPTRPDRAETP